MSKGAKDIDIVVLDSGEPEIRQVSAKNPLQAYKSAVKSFCPPETGGSNILKKEKDLTKDVLPMLYKAFTFKAKPEEFHGNALAFVMSQTPELATLTLRKYKDGSYFKNFDIDETEMGSEVIWRMLSNITGTIDNRLSGNTEEEREIFMRDLEKSILSDIGEKRLTALVKSTQSLIKSIVFYFRFINQPQLLVCDDDDYVSVVSNFIGALPSGTIVNEGGRVRIPKVGMFRTVESYGLLPVPVYSRSVFKAQPDKEERFLRVFGISALKMGYTTIQDMPKLADQLALVEEPLTKAVEKVIEDREDEIALLDAGLYDDAEWLDMISYTDDAITKYNESVGNFEEDLAEAKEDGDLRKIRLSQRALRHFVKNGWKPTTPIGFDTTNTWIGRGDSAASFKWAIRVGYNRRYLQQQTIDKLIAIRNLTEKYDDNAVLRAQVKELEKERDELLEKEGGAGTGSSEDLDELKEGGHRRGIGRARRKNERKGNDYDILAQVLDRLGVNVEKVIDEAYQQGTESFVNSSEFNDLVIEPVERSLF